MMHFGSEPHFLQNELMAGDFPAIGNCKISGDQ